MDKNKKRHPIGQYFLNIAIAVDQLGNVFWGGDHDETISSRLGKMKKHHGGKIPWTRPLPRIIDWGLEIIDKGHSIDAIEADEGKNSVLDMKYQKPYLKGDN